MKVKKRMSNIRGINIFIFLVLFSGCALEPDDPGQCRLDCSKAKIGSSSVDWAIEVKTTIPTFECSAASTPFSGPVFLKFLAKEKYKDGDTDRFNPVPYLSFEPLINGALHSVYHPENVSEFSEGQTLPDGSVAGAGTTYYPYRYLGITTPKSNWCSDSCGVMTIEFVPVCPPSGANNDVSVQLNSGGLFSDEAVVKISTP